MALDPLASPNTTHACNILNSDGVLRVVRVDRNRLVLGSSALIVFANPIGLTGFGEVRSAVVGDWVSVRNDGGELLSVTGIKSRISEISRVNEHGKKEVLVANVSVAFIVFALDQQLNYEKIERYVALVRRSGVRAILVMTKADMVASQYGDRFCDTLLQSMHDRFDTGLQILIVNSNSLEARGLLTATLTPLDTAVLLGPSGVGKSTLTNLLAGEEVALTGSTSSSTRLGRHTTTFRQLHHLPCGASLIDTPGLRALLIEGGPSGVALSFPDIGSRAKECKYRDCSHAHEPGCAVRGTVDEQRISNYNKLIRESKRLTQSRLEAEQIRAGWKRVSKGIKARKQDS
jgi:ribosome biogenesis GTPase